MLIDLYSTCQECIVTDCAFDRWFELEFKAVYGIDLFDFEFNKEKGYSVFRKGNIEVLIITLESLNKNFHKISDFLNLKTTIPMGKKNISNEKWYYKDYRYVVKHFKLNNDILKEIYSKKHFNYFYTSDHKDNFIQQWMS